MQDLIAKEVNEGISPERIVIGGFSQGGSLALYTALGTDVKVGGLLIMSSWMPLHKQFSSGVVSSFLFKHHVLLISLYLHRCKKYIYGKMGIHFHSDFGLNLSGSGERSLFFCCCCSFISIKVF